MILRGICEKFLKASFLNLSVRFFGLLVNVLIYKYVDPKEIGESLYILSLIAIVDIIRPVGVGTLLATKSNKYINDNLLQYVRLDIVVLTLKLVASLFLMLSINGQSWEAYCILFIYIISSPFESITGGIRSYGKFNHATPYEILGYTLSIAFLMLFHEVAMRADLVVLIVYLLPRLFTRISEFVWTYRNFSFAIMPACSLKYRVNTFILGIRESFWGIKYDLLMYITASVLSIEILPYIKAAMIFCTIPQVLLSTYGIVYFYQLAKSENEVGKVHAFLLSTLAFLGSMLLIVISQWFDVQVNLFAYIDFKFVTIWYLMLISLNYVSNRFIRLEVSSKFRQSLAIMIKIIAPFFILYTIGLLLLDGLVSDINVVGFSIMIGTIWLVFNAYQERGLNVRLRDS